MSIASEIGPPPGETGTLAERLRWLRQSGIFPGLRPTTGRVALIEAADDHGVDPRWLLTGRESPAATAAIARLMALGWTEQDQAVYALVAALQPALASGVCRYCGCNDIHGCEAGCVWVDRDHTVCSACLEDH